MHSFHSHLASKNTRTSASRWVLESLLPTIFRSNVEQVWVFLLALVALMDSLILRFLSSLASSEVLRGEPMRLTVMLTPPNLLNCC